MANKEPGYIEGFEALLGVSTDFITYGSEDKDPEIKEEDKNYLLNQNKQLLRLNHLYSQFLSNNEV